MAQNYIYSFQEIVDKITTEVGSKSENLTDFSEGSNLRTIIEAFAYFVEFLQLQHSVAYDSFSVRTAVDEDLRVRVRDYNIEPKSAIQAYGDIVFSRETPAPSEFVIYAGSQVSTQPDILGTTIDYTVDTDITFPSGALTATGQVTCTVAGSIGNVPSGTITNITSTISGVDSVVNPGVFGTGSDEESADALRERLVAHINGLKAGNEDAIKAAVLSVDGIFIARVEEGVPSLGQVTVYVSNQSGTLSAAQIDAVKNAAEAAAAFGIQINVVTPIIEYITIEIDVERNTTSYTKNVLEETIRDLLMNYVNKNAETKLKQWDILLEVGKIPGITNARDVLINDTDNDYESEGFSVLKLADKYASITINWIN